MSKPIARIVIVGIPGMVHALRQVAERQMPKLWAAVGDIEYDSITPHGLATEVAGKIAEMAPDIILIGLPQQEVSTWDIYASLDAQVTCDTVIVRTTKAENDRGQPTKPCTIFSFGELDRLCAHVQQQLLQRLTLQKLSAK